MEEIYTINELLKIKGVSGNAGNVFSESNLYVRVEW